MDEKISQEPKEEDNIFTEEKVKDAQENRQYSLYGVDPLMEWDEYFNSQFGFVFLGVFCLYNFKRYLGRKYEDVESRRLQSAVRRSTTVREKRSIEEIRIEEMQRARQKQQEIINLASKREKEKREQQERERLEEKDRKMREHLAEKNRFRLGTTPEAEGIGSGHSLSSPPNAPPPLSPPTSESPHGHPEAAKTAEEIKAERRQREEELREDMRRVREKQQEITNLASQREREQREQLEKENAEEKDRKIRERLAEEHRFRLGTAPETDVIRSGHALNSSDSIASPPPAPSASPVVTEAMKAEEIEAERRRREEELREDMRRVREKQQAYITAKTKEDAKVREEKQKEKEAQAKALEGADTK